MRAIPRSILNYCRLVAAHRLHLKTERLGALYRVRSCDYAVFRETVNLASVGDPIVLVVGFRLKAIGSVGWLHWLFQRLCILTTPFWSGIPGFGVKLWMVNPDTKDYLGIYDWRGEMQAKRYLDFLIPILNFFSVGGSVWREMLSGRELEDYLEEIRLR